MKENWKKVGYVDEPIPEDIDLKTAIRTLCAEKNAVIMAHYYTEGAVQDVADFIAGSGAEGCRNVCGNHRYVRCQLYGRDV